MIPVYEALDQSVMTRLQEHDPLVQRYRGFFAQLDWTALQDQDAGRRLPGPHPHPETAYLKAFLVKICEEKRYMTQLRTFLLEHPLLVLELGFHPVADPHALYGFDVQRSVPTARWFGEKLRHLDPFVLSDLLQQTVDALCDSRHLMAAKNAITWPLSTTIQAQSRLLATKHKMAESTKIKQFLAESANSANGFHRLLMRSQHLAAAKTYN